MNLAKRAVELHGICGSDNWIALEKAHALEVLEQIENRDMVDYFGLEPMDTQERPIVGRSGNDPAVVSRRLM